MKRRFLFAGIAAAALLQTAALGKMIQDRAALLQNGRDVVLQTGMIDPRDLFRGHYTIVNLSISRIERSDQIAFDLPKRGEDVYVSLAPGDGVFWQPVAVTAKPPTGDTPILKGTLQSILNTSLRISFPFDRYFAPKARAKELEGIRSERALGLIVATAPDGTGAVKGITVNGVAHVIEPLY